MNPRNILIAIAILLIAAGLVGCTDKTHSIDDPGGSGDAGKRSILCHYHVHRP